jgi:hypothetical protein
MLASITPLGERSRGSSWPVTVAAFIAGAVAAGALAGASIGEIGGLLPDGHGWRAALVLTAVAVAVLFDATPLRARLPTSRRQVNEDWLARYRGWVYGLGFGAQLGLGVVTIVTSATIYSTAAVALAASRPGIGALVGASFGAVRGLSLVFARQARDPLSLGALHRRLAGLEPGVRRSAAALELLTLATVVAWLA